MDKIKEFFSKPLSIIAFLIVCLATAIAVIFPASHYISQTSLSPTNNFYIVGGLYGLLILLAVFEALLVVRLIWGAAAITGDLVKRKKAPADQDVDGDDLDGYHVKSLGATGTKSFMIFGALLVLNVIVFEILGGGILVTGTRRYNALTLLRSTSGADRISAIKETVQLVGDEEIAAALKNIIETPGDGRQWAAYAVGVRLDYGSIPSIVKLIRTGNAEEMSAGLTALARMDRSLTETAMKRIGEQRETALKKLKRGADSMLIPLAIEAYPRMDVLKKDALIAMGMLGKIDGVTDESQLVSAGKFLLKVVKQSKNDKALVRLAIWVMGRLETAWARGQHDAASVLPFLDSLLSKETDVATLCITLEALGKISAAESSPKMLKLVPLVEKDARCEEIVAADFTGYEVLLSGGLNLVQRIVREVANIGDAEAQIFMERLAEDPSFSKEVRTMAREIAFALSQRGLI